MKTFAVSNSPSFNGKYTVNYKDNKHIKLLSNYLCDLSKKEHLTAKFATDYVELNTVTAQQDNNVLTLLKKIFANYSANGEKVVNKI